MKKTAFILAALLLGASASAQDTTFKFSGSLGAEYESTNNKGDFDDNVYDKEDEIVQKTKVSLDIAKGDKITARLTMSNLMLWGDTRTFNGTDTSVKSDTTKSNLLQVEEAYAVLKVNEESSLQFGRGQYHLGQGELISKRNYENTPVSFDGLLYIYDIESVRLGAFYVRGADDNLNDADGNATPSSIAANRNTGDFLGVTATFKNLPDFLNDVVVHYIQANSEALDSDNNGSITAADIPDSDRAWIGLSATGEMNVVDYHFSYIKFDGELGTIDRDGDMMHLGAGFNMPEFMGFRVGVEYHQDSGDESGSIADGKSETFDPLYTDFRRYSGQAEVLTWGKESGTTLTGGGLTYIAIRTKLEPSEDLKLRLDYFMFEQTEKQGLASDELGSEIDLMVEKAYDSGLKTHLTYAIFQPGDAYATDDDATVLRAGMSFDF